MKTSTSRSKFLLWPLLASTTAVGKVIHSGGSGGVATGVTRDPKTGDLVVVGTIYEESFWDMDAANGKPTSCFMVTGNFTKAHFERQAVHTPELCFGDVVVVDQGDLQSQSVVTGTSAGMSDLVTLYDYEHLEHTYALSKEYYPVTMSHNEGDKVIVGFHQYKGLPFEGDVGNEQGLNLNDLIKFWDRLKTPNHMTSTVSRLTKMSTNTGRVHFDKHLKTHFGVTTIAKIVHLKHQNRFMVAGSTTGSGEHIGAYPRDKIDWDGYVAIFDETTGEIVFGGADNRIQSEEEADDFVHSICTHKEYVFIVGVTEGTIADDAEQQGGAFVIKMDTKTLEVKWKKQIQGSYDNLRCEAHYRGVFVGGMQMVKEAETGKIVSDVFVSRFDYTGDQMWAQKLDSELVTHERGDDVLVDLDVSHDGKELIALMNTRVLHRGENKVMLVDIDIHTGESDLSRDIILTAQQVDIISDDSNTGHLQVFWWLSAVCGAGLLFLLNGKRRQYMREKHARDKALAECDYENNLKKWMDDDEIFDYDQDGLYRSELADKKHLKLKPNVRGDLRGFGAGLMSSADRRFYDVEMY
ncbi:unnamed protein product [Cylindrotheca closterium]|uniref:Uncharacterized protein n=1 Tax=Cylindrotheca closterium TaxID=2856 RepID=A0AAD2GDB2_9STRA|nr:unnamed protein product [Cylindrotheca closterium]